MGLDPITAPLLFLGAAGLGVSMIEGGKAQRDARKQQEWQKQQHEEQVAYERQMREEAMAKEEAALNRKFEADMSTYNQSMQAIDDAISYWAGLEQDPRSHPGWESFERGLEQETEQRQTQTEETLRRRGITGGAQTEAVMDIQKVVQSTLANTLLDVSKQASMKQLELEQMRPQVPYRGQETYQGAVNIGSSYRQPPQLPLIGRGGVDLSGLGMATAMLMKDKDDVRLPTDMIPGTSTNFDWGGMPGGSRIQDYNDWFVIQ